MFGFDVFAVIIDGTANRGSASAIVLVFILICVSCREASAPHGVQEAAFSKTKIRNGQFFIVRINEKGVRNGQPPAFLIKFVIQQAETVAGTPPAVCINSTQDEH
jgi:hypothetical protein